MDKRNNIQLMLFQGQFNRSYVHLKARERRKKKRSAPLDVYMYNMCCMIDSSNSNKEIGILYLTSFLLNTR
jgi:hypothetical protein